VPVEPEITVPVSAKDAFAVLADGWLYALWVVGASHIRAVDDDWPAVGSHIHHSVGPWPFTLNDSTKVLAADPPHFLELEARLWPAGAAWIRLTITEVEPYSTVVKMAERANSGPARLLPGLLQDSLLLPRNRESLSRLADLIIGRQAGIPGSVQRDLP
jgi:hypothetical protein